VLLFIFQQFRLISDVVRSFQLLSGALNEDIKIRIFGLPTLRRRLEIEMNIGI